MPHFRITVKPVAGADPALGFIPGPYVLKAAQECRAKEMALALAGSLFQIDTCLVATNRQVFEAKLTEIYVERFKLPAYAQIKAQHRTPENWVKVKTAQIDEGTFGVDSLIIEEACEALGVPHTAEAIYDFLGIVRLTPRQRFEAELTIAFTALFPTPAYAQVRRDITPEKLAAEVTDAFCNQRGSNSGKGAKLACKALGIKPTYKEIEKFLGLS